MSDAAARQSLSQAVDALNSAVMLYKSQQSVPSSKIGHMANLERAVDNAKHAVANLEVRPFDPKVAPVKLSAD